MSGFRSSQSWTVISYNSHQLNGAYGLEMRDGSLDEVWSGSSIADEEEVDHCSIISIKRLLYGHDRVLFLISSMGIGRHWMTSGNICDTGCIED